VTTYAEPTALRNGDLTTIHAMLTEQRVRAIDVVVGASQFNANSGRLYIHGAEPEITDEGVNTVNGMYDMLRTADTQLADMLGVPGAYMRRMHTDAVDMWDDTVNGWLRGVPAEMAESSNYPQRPGERRRFLLRLLRGDAAGAKAVVRAVLSDRYRTIDNLDVLLACLAGVQESGTDITVEGADLTDTRMRVRVSAPAIAALAPELLKNYRSPFGGGGAVRVGQGGWTPERALAAARNEGQGYEPGTEPVVFAGFEISNSDTGGGAFTLTPRLVVKICRNGLTITADALREVHLGGKLDEGVVRWSEDTQRKSLALITARARDAVATFLNADYVAAKVAELEEQAGEPVKDAAKAVEIVAQRFAFNDVQAASILDHFILGGQLTAGGIMQAVSSVAATVDDGEQAAAMEAAAVPAMALVAAGR
jgi:dsDNA-binding SOS-regulon protein